MEIKSFILKLSVVTIFFSLIILSGILAAWTPPSNDPPLGNVDAPIHSGTSSQMKWGNLSINSGKSFENGLLVFGKVGFGTTTPEIALDVIGGTANTIGTIRTYQNVASFNNSGNPITGTLKIAMPRGWSSTMMQMKIQGYQYNDGYGAWELLVGGYNYAPTPKWYNGSAEIRGTAPFNQVRLAYDGTKNVILLGNTTTAWRYPKIVITEFITGHSNILGWGSGWDISVIGSETGITNIYTPTIKMGGLPAGSIGQTLRYDGTSWIGNSLLYNDGINVGVGTTTLAARLAIQSTSTNDILNLFETGGSEVFTVLESGNVGIGASAPGAGLHVGDPASGPVAIFDTDTNTQPLYVTRLGVANESLSIGVTDNNAYISTAQDENSAGYGNLIMRLGNQTSQTPDFQLSDFRSGTDVYRLYVDMDTGNVGIGTTAPTTFKLQVAGNIGPNANNAYDFGTSSLAWRSITFNKGYFTTLDPIYKINEKKYATYVADTVGLKAEVIGEKEFKGNKVIIDLANQKEGSDLWLFYNIVKKDTIIPFVSSQSPVSLYGYIEGSNFIIKTITENTGIAKFSYRLVGERIDNTAKDNLAEDQNISMYTDIDKIK